MLAQLLEMFGFLSVLLRGLTLALEAVVLGGAVFTLRRNNRLKSGEPQHTAVADPCRKLMLWAAVTLLITTVCFTASDYAILTATTGLGLSEVAGANFFIAGLLAVGGAVSIVALTLRKAWRPAPAMLIPCAMILTAQVMTSHAAGRIEHRAVLFLLAAVHQGAMATWIGALPYLLLTLRQCSQLESMRDVAGRFSIQAIISVTALVASGLGMGVAYVGSPDALYGTSYGLMVTSKAILLGMVLTLGAINFHLVRGIRQHGLKMVERLRRFAEAEIAIGFTVILAAASLTSQPPAVDITTGRTTLADIADRMRPRLPRLHTPGIGELSPATPLIFGRAGVEDELRTFVPGTTTSVSSPGDIAWSEYNHNWAGLVVLVVGVLALIAQRTGVRWARSWPLGFLGLAAFLFFRADPENWPLGPRSFWQSFVVPDVLQHRIFIALIAAFAIFERRVQSGLSSSPRAALFFPAVCMIGGALLFTHSHPLGNIKEEVLAEISHSALAILAVGAGAARWLELRSPEHPQWLRWTWPVCLAFIGVLLLTYRES